METVSRNGYSKDILSANGQHWSTLVSLFRAECSGLSSPLFFEAFAKILLKCIRLRTIAAGGMCIKRQQNSGGWTLRSDTAQSWHSVGVSVGRLTASSFLSRNTWIVDSYFFTRHPPDPSGVPCLHQEGCTLWWLTSGLKANCWCLRLPMLCAQH